MPVRGNYYHMSQEMSSGTLAPVRYFRRPPGPSQPTASKEAREAFTAAAAAHYAVANGIDVAAAKMGKVTMIAGRPESGVEI